MNLYKLQRQSCHVILLVILTSWSLCVRVNSAFTSFEAPSAIRTIADIRSVDTLAPLKVMDRNAMATADNLPGRINTLDVHIQNTFQDRQFQTQIRQWINEVNEQKGVPILDNGLYAERDFIQYLFAWHLSREGTILPERFKVLHEDYYKYEPHIPANSFLRTTRMTPPEFVGLYLPAHDRKNFEQTIKAYKNSQMYHVSDLFMLYGTFALQQVLRDGKAKRWTRALFADQYIPRQAVTTKFYEHLNEINALPMNEWHTAKDMMNAYLKWLTENKISELEKPWLFTMDQLKYIT